MKIPRKRMYETETEWFDRLRPLFAIREQEILDFFASRQKAPTDGSFMLGVFIDGWQKAKRKFGAWNR